MRRHLAWPVVLGAAFAIGVAGFLSEAAQGQALRAWGILTASWLFLAGAAVGAVAFRAVLELTGARWAGSLAPDTERVARFLPVAAVFLVVLVVAHATSAPWVTAASPTRVFWLNVPFFAARELTGGVVLFATARSVAHRPSPRRAVVFCLVYAVVLSFWAYDFVLGLDPRWVSTLIGPHLFVGAFLSGMGLLAVLGLASGRLEAAQRHDLGKLLFGFSIFWAYLLWSQYLPIWYGNLPDEVGFVLKRTSAPWRTAAIAVVVLTLVVPFVVLLPERAKRSRAVLAGIAALQLLGLWLERHLLVAPSLLRSGEPALDPRDIAIALGVLAAFVLSIGRAPQEAPRPQPRSVRVVRFPLHGDGR